jgi:methylated-DNA-[protein]-cysteine S-methyltransferase
MHQGGIMHPDNDQQEIHCRTISSPIGELAFHADAEHLYAIDSIKGDRRIHPGRQGRNQILVEAERQLRAYFAGRLRVFDLPLRPVGTEFQLAVWQAMRGIAYGAVLTYGELAALVGGRNKARAVGQAANRNPLMIVIPCHRVIGRDGRLVGFGAGVDKKDLLLRHELGEEVWPQRPAAGSYR